MKGGVAKSESSDVEITVSGGILLVRFNRPSRHNALTPEMIVRTAQAWRRVRDDSDVKVAIVTGAGTKAFSSGGDLSLLLPLFSGARLPEDEWDESIVSDGSLMKSVFLKGFDLGKPLIAAINGSCLGGGMELAIAADLRIAATHATFGLPEVRRGLLPAAGSLVRLPRQIPSAIAKEIILTGEPINAERACNVGFLNAVVPEGMVLDHATAMAERIAANGPLAVRLASEVIATSCSGVPLSEAFAVEARANAAIQRSADAREGARAFVEKRPPNFTGT